MIYIKNKQQIEGIKKACAIWKKVKQEIIKNTKPGISLKELDQIASDVVQLNNAKCSFYKYQDFPGHICISVNEQLIHGVPSKYTLKKSDIVSFDIGVTYDGYICDAAFSIVLDDNNVKAHKINNATIACLDNAIKQVKPDNYTGDIANAIETTAKQFGYTVIKDFAGHGCGIKLHEDPKILNYGDKHSGTKLVPNMVICIEPMLMTDDDQYVIDTKNGWTVSSANSKLTCHHEHMVLITTSGCEVLTA